MGSKGRIPPPHLRHPMPAAGMVHPEAFGPGMHSMPGPFPPFDLLPPPEVLEQKLAAQHVEMQRLATENKRLAATHGTLRQELAAAQHELQMLHVHIGSIKAEREQQMRGLLDKIVKMESELKNAEPVRGELQQARVEAEKLVVARQELVAKGHQLTQDLHRAHSDVQQFPALMSELESLRQEYQRCRISYDSEKKLFSDHLESLQVMEKNYMAMAGEVEKLRAQLSNTNNLGGVPYGGNTANNESDPSGRLVGHHGYADGYSGPQVQGHPALPSNTGAVNVNAGAAGNVGAAAGTSANVGAQSGPGPSKNGFDAPRVPGYEPQRSLAYDPQKAGYDVQRGQKYDPQRGPGYDLPKGVGYDVRRAPAYDPTQRMPGYDVQRGPFYDAQRGVVFDMQRGTNSYDAASRGAAGLHGQVAPTNVPYGSATPPNRATGGYDAPGRGGNPVRK